MFEFELSPDVLLQAYREGIFPIADARDGEIFWCRPEERGVLDFGDLRISRSLRKVLRSGRFRVTSDVAFGDVVLGCAAREETWISHVIEGAYRKLFELGHAHSVEVWEGESLVGGLYGVAIGGLFAGESMFHRVTDASKVALVGLVGMLRDEYADQRLLDVQWSTPHLASLGVVEVPRSTYLDLLEDALEVPLPAVFR